MRLDQGGSRKALQSAFQAKIPKPLVIANIYYFLETEAQDYVRALTGRPQLEADPSAPIRLIRLSTLAERLDCHPRTFNFTVS